LPGLFLFPADLFFTGDIRCDGHGMGVNMGDFGNLL
jgi:hypothetical protein